MALPPQRDPSETAKTLTRWMEARPGVADVSLAGLEMPPANGFSNETILLDARWRQDSLEHEERLVLRIAPTAFEVFPEPEYERQLRLLQVLGGRSDVLVPKVHWVETDTKWFGAPFYLVERVDGVVPSDNLPYTMDGWLLEATPEQQRSVWESGVDAMAAVHRLDWRALGLEFLDRPEVGRRGVDQELGYYERYLDWVEGQGRPQPTCRAALPWLREHQPADEPEPALCWGDARIGNQIFHDYRCAAVLDWENAILGDPESDLAWFLYFDRQFSDALGVPRLPGFPEPEETVARWEAATGRQVRNLEYYEILSGFEFSVILGRLGQLAQQFELVVPGGPDMETNNIATQFLAQLLDLPAPV